ncbi:MAG: phosphonopyruvate decarboxylase [Planctomycetes bacterium]|nr:phosphonopyruvate decarboxylase [Planctomycetota bacterium]
MFSAARFCEQLQRHGAGVYVGVPDTVIQSFCNYLCTNPPPGGHIIAANEGGAVGLAVGNHLATGLTPIVYMQNSGLGNAVNPLLSLADREVYAIPMLLLIGWRGEPGRKDEPQHLKQGKVTEALLDSMGIPYGIVEADFEQAKEVIDRAFAAIRRDPGPYALLIRNGCFEPSPPADAGYPGTGITREQAIRVVVGNAGPAAIVASTGMASRELYEIRESLGQDHSHDFLNVGAMGHASQIAAGVALGAPGRAVVCLDGDGALFMHLGGLALIPSLDCANLIHVLLNNGVHDSVGGQPVLSERNDLAELATTVGYSFVYSVEDENSLAAALRESIGNIARGGGPHCIEVRLARGFRSDLGRPQTPFTQAARQFADYLQHDGE